MNSKELMERLLEFEDRDVPNGTGDGGTVKLRVYHNRDGQDAAAHIAALDARIEALEGANSKLRRCLSPIQMGLAQAECIDEPIPDDAVVISFMGSGASDHVTAGEIRAALGGEHGG